MRALRVENGNVRIREVAQPTDPSEALVRVIVSGICKTDLEICRGYAGFNGTIGHEFVGRVERADDVPELVGRRVVGEINVGCNECPLCVGGDQRHCPSRSVLGIVARDGSHADYLQLPSHNLIVVPENVPDELAVFVEPLAAATGISEVVNLTGDERVCAIGDGKLGLLCALALARKSCKIDLIGKHPEKLRIAEASKANGILLDNISDSMLGTYDVVIEASGSGSGIRLAADLVRPRGTIVLKSTFAGAAAWPSAKIVVNEIVVVGSRCGRFASALSLLGEGDIDLSVMISARFQLAEGLAAMQQAAQPGALKVLLHTGGH